MPRMSEPTPVTKAPTLWRGLAVLSAALLLLGIMASAGFGSLTGGLTLHPTGLQLLAVLLGGAALLPLGAWLDAGGLSRQFRFLLPFVAALATGLAWQYRNIESDAAAYARAQAMEGTGGFVLYLEQVGGAHSEHVRRRALPGRALELAKQEESAVALWRTRQEFADIEGWPDYQSAWERLFGIAAASLEPTAPGGPPEEQARRNVLRSLLSERAREGDPRVPLRFEEGALDWFVELDESLGGEHEGRPVAAASRHLGAQSEEARRAQVASALGEGAKLLLGADVFDFVPVEESSSEERPLIFVRSNIEPGTSVFQVEGRPEVYVELRVVLRLQLTTAEGDVAKLDLELASPDAFTAKRQAGEQESVRSSIYSEMLLRVLDELSYEFARSFGWELKSP